MNTFRSAFARAFAALSLAAALLALPAAAVVTEDDWLKALLLRGFDDMKALARSVLKEAESQYGATDDMTVVTVRVEERA